MKYLIPEIFDMVQKATNYQDQKRILAANDSKVLIDCLRINFLPQMKMDLPEGEPPFKKKKDIPIGYAESNLYKEMRRFYIWLQPSNLTKVRKENLFIELLESIHHTEAAIVVAIKDKKLSTLYPNITYDLCRDLYPQFFPELETPVAAAVVEEAKQEAKQPIDFQETAAPSTGEPDAKPNQKIKKKKLYIPNPYRDKCALSLEECICKSKSIRKGSCLNSNSKIYQYINGMKETKNESDSNESS
jgi:hypothetical protein